MTGAEVKAYIAAQLTAPITQAIKLINSLNVLVDFANAIDNNLIPTWTNLLTFQTDGTDDGQYCKYPDSNGNVRIFETKVDDNIGNTPPVDPLTTENSFWKEISSSAGSAIKEWAPGIYGSGLVIVYYDTTGSDPSLYKLTEPVRPFNSTDFETEVSAGSWKKMTSDIGDVLDVILAGFVLTDRTDVTASDTIIQAFGKIQRQINDVRAEKFAVDGSMPMTGNLNVNGNRIVNLIAAVANGQAVTYEQWISALDGVKVKDDCVAASVTDDVVHYDVQTQDGVVLADGNRFLDKDNADATIRGIWIVRAGTDWERAADSDTGVELQGALVKVTGGTVNADTAWLQATTDVILGTSDLSFVQFGSGVPDASPTTKGKAKLYSSTSLGNNTDGAPDQNAVKTYVDAAVAGATIPDASPTVKGKAKLYSSTSLGSNTDGAPDQNAVKVYVDAAVAGATIPDASPTVKGKAKLYSSTSLGANTDGAPDQNAVKTYVDAAISSAIASLINSAPGALDTLKELADALGDDANFAATVTAALATKALDSAVVKLTGSQTIAGVKTFSSSPIVPTPINPTDAANKDYIDTNNLSIIDDLEIALCNSIYLMTQ